MANNIANQQGTSPQSKLPKVQRIVAVLWPSFLIAGLGTILIFTFFDPMAVNTSEDSLISSRLGTYSLGFLTLWALTTLSSLLTLYFNRPTTEI